MFYSVSIRNSLPDWIAANLSFSIRFIDLLLYSGKAVVYAYWVGIVAWRVLVVSWRLQTLDRQFTISTKFGHPDKAGRLSGLGEICLKIIYVAVVPTPFSALIIFVSYVEPKLLNFQGPGL